MKGRAPAEALQLALLDENDDPIAAWRARQVLAAELEEFRDREQEAHGLSDSSAGVLSRHLASMVRWSRTGTVAAFLSDAPRVLRAIRQIEREATRRARYQAVRDFVELCGDGLPANTQEFLEREFDHLPGRVTPAPQYVDRVLGGSTKQIRIRVPFLWDDGERLDRSSCWKRPGRRERDSGRGPSGASCAQRVSAGSNSVARLGRRGLGARSATRDSDFAAQRRGGSTSGTRGRRGVAPRLAHGRGGASYRADVPDLATTEGRAVGIKRG